MGKGLLWPAVALQHVWPERGRARQWLKAQVPAVSLLRFSLATSGKALNLDIMNIPIIVRWIEWVNTVKFLESTGIQ